MSTEDETSPGGSRMLRHEAPSEPRPFTHDTPVHDAVGAHVAQYLGEGEWVFHEIVSTDIHLDVLVHPAGDERPWHTLVTCGMSALPMTVPEGLEEEVPRFMELTIGLPAEWPLDTQAWEDERHYWPIRMLKLLARLPHEYTTWLGVGHTVPNGDPPEPYAPGTQLCGAVVLPALRAPDGFETLPRPEGDIAFRGIVALHADEMALKLEQGIDALADRLDAAGVSELVDAERPSTVGSRRRRRFGRGS
jgi:hypothetical protein